MRQRGVPAVLGRHPPAGRRLRRHRVQPLGRARLHERPQLHRPGRGRRCAAPTAAPNDPLVGAGGHCTYNPEPLADFVDFVRHRRRRGGRRRDHRGRRATGRPAGAPRARASACCATWPHPGCLRAVDVRRRLRRQPCWSAVTPRTPTSPSVVEKRTVADLADWPYPKQQLVPLTEVVHDRLNVEIFRGCTRGLPVLPGGHDHPPGAGAPGRPGAHDGATRACGAPATTRSRSRRCRAPTSAASTASSPTSSTSPTDCDQVSVSLPSLRVDAFTVGIASRDPEGAPHRASRSPPRAARGGCGR